MGVRIDRFDIKDIKIDWIFDFLRYLITNNQ